jgi:hypothetical protein
MDERVKIRLVNIILMKRMDDGMNFTLLHSQIMDGGHAQIIYFHVNKQL